MRDNPNYSYVHTYRDDEQRTHYFKDSEARDAITELEQSKQDVIDAAHKLLANYISGLAEVATSGDFDDLTNKPNVDVAMSDSSTNAVQNKIIKEYVDQAIAQAVVSLFDYKGEKENLTAIQAISIAKKGDVWRDASTGVEYYAKASIAIATPSNWDSLGMLIDLSGYVLASALGALAYKHDATGSFTPEGSISMSEYTPEGSVSVTPNTTTVNSITAVGTLPTFGSSVSNGVLTFSFSQGTLPTKGTDTTVVTGIQSASFSGTAATPTGRFVGTTGSVLVS